MKRFLVVVFIIFSIQCLCCGITLPVPKVDVIPSTVFDSIMTDKETDLETFFILQLQTKEGQIDVCAHSFDTPDDCKIVFEFSSGNNVEYLLYSYDEVCSTPFFDYRPTYKDITNDGEKDLIISIFTLAGAHGWKSERILAYGVKERRFLLDLNTSFSSGRSPTKNGEDHISIGRVIHFEDNKVYIHSFQVNYMIMNNGEVTHKSGYTLLKKINRYIDLSLGRYSNDYIGTYEFDRLKGVFVRISKTINK